MKWGDEAAVIKIDVKKFFYSIDRQVLKKIIAKRFKKLKKKYPDKYEDFLRFYRLLCKVIDSSPEGETRHTPRECQLPGLRQHLPQRARPVLHPLPRC